MNMYRGEVRPRRQPPRHHVEPFAESHRHRDVSDPFPPLSSKQFPAMYTHDPIKNQYRRYMRAKQPYRKT
jgi:hypothetical protein